MSVEMSYVGEERQHAIRCVEGILKKFIGEGKVTYFEVNKNNKDLVRFKNDESARRFIDELRVELDSEQVLINFQPFYKSRR
jgi:hypothetical protein